MKKSKKRCLAGVLSAVMLLMSSGCSSSSGSIYTNYRELEQIQIIQTMGVDLDGEETVVSVSTGTTQEKTPSTLMSVSAPSIVSAMDNLQDYAAEERLFYAHVKYFLIGQETAETGITPYLDYIERSTQLRQNMNVFIVKDISAKELITSSTDPEYDITNIMPTIEKDIEMKGTSTPSSCSDISRQLARQGAALVCVIYASDLKGTVFTVEDGITAIPYGYGVLKDGKLIALIEKEQSRGVNLILNKAGTGNIPLSDEQGNLVTVSLDGCKTEVKPLWSDTGALEAIRINCKLEAAVAESDSSIDLKDEALVEMLNRALEEKARGWMQSVVDLSQDEGADFLGLGRMLEISSPVKFSKIEADWPKLLESTEIKIHVQARIQRSYDIINSADTDGGGMDNVTGTK